MNKKPQPGGEHEVHNLDDPCDHLPTAENQHDLGYCVSCYSAVIAARRIYDKVDGCYYCANECHRR